MVRECMRGGLLHQAKEAKGVLRDLDAAIAHLKELSLGVSGGIDAGTTTAAAEDASRSAKTEDGDEASSSSSRRPPGGGSLMNMVREAVTGELVGSAGMGRSDVGEAVAMSPVERDAEDAPVHIPPVSPAPLTVRKARPVEDASMPLPRHAVSVNAPTPTQRGEVEVEVVLSLPEGVTSARGIEVDAVDGRGVEVTLPPDLGLAAVLLRPVASAVDRAPKVRVTFSKKTRALRLLVAVPAPVAPPPPPPPEIRTDADAVRTVASALRSEGVALVEAFLEARVVDDLLADLAARRVEGESTAGETSTSGRVGGHVGGGPDGPAAFSLTLDAAAVDEGGERGALRSLCAAVDDLVVGLVGDDEDGETSAVPGGKNLVRESVEYVVRGGRRRPPEASDDRTSSEAKAAAARAGALADGARVAAATVFLGDLDLEDGGSGNGYVSTRDAVLDVPGGPAVRPRRGLLGVAVRRSAGTSAARPSPPLVSLASAEIRTGEGRFAAITVWYSDGDRMQSAERTAAAALLDARRDVHLTSLDALRAKVAARPADLAARRRLVDAALKAGAVDEAVEAAAAGADMTTTATDRGRGGFRGRGKKPSFSSADVAEAHFAHGVALQARYASDQKSRRERPADLLAAAAAYRRCRSADPRHRAATENLLVVLQHVPTAAAAAEIRTVAASAVATGGVLPFRDPRQRPNVYDPSLEAKPWWDPDAPEFAAFVPALRRAAPAMREEALRVLGDDRVCDPSRALSYAAGMRAGDDGVRRTEGLEGVLAGEKENENEKNTPGWRKVVGRGAWREIVLYGGGRRVDGNCAMCPAAAAAADAVASAASLALAGGGEILLSILDPGTHLRPHCGPSNNRLTVHLGLVVPPGCSITVGGDTRGWTEGEAIVFDDSFEHEVTHAGTLEDGPRVVLMMNVWHPALVGHPEAQAASLERFAAQQVQYAAGADLGTVG